MTSIHGNHDLFVSFLPLVTSKKNNVLPKKPSKLLYYFLSLCKTFNELFFPPPFRAALKKALLPESECKGRHFYRNSQAFHQ